MTRYSACTYTLYACIVAFLNHYQLSGEGLTILALLMLMDTFLGIGKSYVLHSDDPGWFSSKKLRNGVIAKVAVLMVSLLLAVVIGFMSHTQQITGIITNTALGLLIVAEFVSVLQNTIMIRQRKHIQERDAISAVLNWLLSVVKTFIKEKIDE